MDNFILKETASTPYFSGQTNGEILIKGKSLMDNPLSFYGPIREWMAGLIKSKVETIIINMDLQYINSSSTKQLLRLLMDVDEFDSSSTVNWFYPPDSDYLKERGEEFEVLLDLEFKYHQK